MVFPWPCFLWCDTDGDSFPGAVPHSVKQYTNYRLWNLVSKKEDGLLKRHSDKVICDGSFDSNSNTSK